MIIRRALELPTLDSDRIGHKVTITVEAWVTKIEAELIDVSTPDEPGMTLPGDSWTTFAIGKATRA